MAPIEVYHNNFMNIEPPDQIWGYLRWWGKEEPTWLNPSSGTFASIHVFLMNLGILQGFHKASNSFR